MYLKNDYKKITSYYLFKKKLNKNNEKIIQVVKNDNHYKKLLKNLNDEEISDIILGWAKAICYNRKVYYNTFILPFHLEKILQEYL